MQYKNLQLDRIQAFAPVPKQIDKQNYKDMAEALMNLGARGADVYASYKINQIPAGKERDLALAEYQLLRHQDPSALQKIEERRYEDYWRDRQENVQREMLEQSRAEAEAESKREDFNTRHKLEVDNTRIIGLLRQGRRENPDINIQNLDLETYARKHEPELFAQLETNNHILKTLGGNVTSLTPQIYKKGVEVSVPEIKTSGNSMSGSYESYQMLKNLDFKNLDYKIKGNRDAVFKSDFDYISNLDDVQVKILHDYIDKQLNPSGKYILDTDKDKVLNKYPNEHLKEYIDNNYKVETQKERKTRQSNETKKEKEKETEKNVANAIRKNTSLFGIAPDGYTNKQVIDWAKDKVQKGKIDKGAQKKLDEIFNTYKYER